MNFFDKRMQKILSQLAETKFFLIIMVVISIFITSCDKSSEVGLDVQPAGDLLDINFQDTATLITKTVKMDSLRTDETLMQTYKADPSAGSYMLGTYADPVFGKSSSSIYTQLNLSASPFFGVNPKIDSAVLSLVYDPSYYGQRSLTQQNVNVYEISENIAGANSYYSNTSLSVASVDLANNYTFIPNLTKTDTIFGEPLRPQLRIRLLNYGQAILNAQYTSDFVNNDAFQNFKKGLYITTEKTNLNSQEGNILRFNLEDPQSRLTIYYHNDASTSLTSYFTMGGAAHFSNFKHQYTSLDPDLASQLSSNPPTQNDAVFIQSMAGLKVKVEIPYITSWNKQDIGGINKAELVVKVNQGNIYQFSIYTPPEKLVLYGINDDGSIYSLPDFGEGSNYFGGVYNASTNEYRINISRYIEQVLNGKRKNNGLCLQIVNGALNSTRAAIGGGGAGSGAYQMKLHIVKTKLP